MLKTSLRLLAIALIVSFAHVSAYAQTTGNQTFTVNVPTSVSIVAPSAASINHDETDNNNAFPAQTWIVKGNAINGVNVSFATATPFTHATLPSMKRDTKLDLAVGTTVGPALWTVTTPTDTSNYLSGDNNALVAATSNGVGRANMQLTVSFVTGAFGEFAAGAYTTTVTGTVAANP
jgi:hypothetical protein